MRRPAFWKAVISLGASFMHLATRHLAKLFKPASNRERPNKAELYDMAGAAR